jgi:hypothetical protein
MTVVKNYEIEILSIPYIYKGIKRKYFPDILVTYHDFTQEIIEIKPYYLLNDKKNKVKFETAQKFATNNKMKYSVWTEKTHKLAA